MILLPVAQATMAVAADNDQVIAVAAASDVMKLQGQRIVAWTEEATGVIRTQSFERHLCAALAVQFVLVHGSNSFR
jgi:hypothetical protein